MVMDAHESGIWWPRAWEPSDIRAAACKGTQVKSK